MGCEGYENIILQLRVHDFFFTFCTSSLVVFTPGSNIHHEWSNQLQVGMHPRHIEVWSEPVCPGPHWSIVYLTDVICVNTHKTQRWTLQNGHGILWKQLCLLVNPPWYSISCFLSLKCCCTGPSAALSLTVCLNLRTLSSCLNPVLHKIY